MLHDLTDSVYDVVYHPYRVRLSDRVILIREGRLTILTEEPLTLPCYGEIRPYLKDARYRYLFSIGAERFFGVFAASAETPFLTVPVLSVRHLSPKANAFAAAMGNQLIGWYERSAFCGRCGAKTEHSPKERMMRCPKCGNLIYPQICPGVIIGVFHEGKLLVTRYNPNHMMVNNGKTFRPTPKDTLVAGYVESGETAEQTVVREVFEEVGLKVRNIRYYKSAPWPFSGSLLLAYLCDVDGSADLTIDPEELSFAAFKSPEEIDDRLSDVSLTAEIMKAFKAGKLL